MTSEDEVNELLGIYGLEVFDEETKFRIDEILSTGQAVEPETRRKLVLAAQRGIREYQYLQGPFEILAFETRQAKSMDVDQLAESVGLSAETLRAIERGAIALLDQDSLFVARWIDELGVGHEEGYKAVERSVWSPNAIAAYAKTGSESELSEKASKFLREVKLQLDKLQ